MINILAVNSYSQWRLSWLSAYYQAIFDAAHKITLEPCCECSCGSTTYRRVSFGREPPHSYIDNGLDCSGCLKVYTHKDFQGDYERFCRDLCADCRQNGLPMPINPGALPMERIRPEKLVPRRSVAPAIRARILARDRYCCRYCGRKWPDVVMEVDHVVPAVMGGTDDESNLVAACVECNRRKGTLDAEIFVASLPVVHQTTDQALVLNTSPKRKGSDAK